MTVTAHPLFRFAIKISCFSLCFFFFRFSFLRIPFISSECFKKALVMSYELMRPVLGHILTVFYGVRSIYFIPWNYYADEQFPLADRHGNKNLLRLYKSVMSLFLQMTAYVGRACTSLQCLLLNRNFIPLEGVWPEVLIHAGSGVRWQKFSHPTSCNSCMLIGYFCHAN